MKKKTKQKITTVWSLKEWVRSLKEPCYVAWSGYKPPPPSSPPVYESLNGVVALAVDGNSFQFWGLTIKF